MNYRVVYEIDIVADSPIEAAREAFACIVDPESAPPVLDVIPWVDDDTPPTFTCDTPNCTSVELEQE